MAYRYAASGRGVVMVDAHVGHRGPGLERRGRPIHAARSSSELFGTEPRGKMAISVRTRDGRHVVVGSEVGAEVAVGVGDAWDDVARATARLLHDSHGCFQRGGIGLRLRERRRRKTCRKRDNQAEGQARSTQIATTTTSDERPLRVLLQRV